MAPLCSTAKLSVRPFCFQSIPKRYTAMPI